MLVQCLHCSRHFQVVTAQLARVCWATVICNKTITVNCNKMLCTLFYQAEANKKLCYHKKNYAMPYVSRNLANCCTNIGTTTNPDKLDCRQVLWTTRSTCHGEIFYDQSLGHSSRGKYPYFWRLPKFPYNIV